MSERGLPIADGAPACPFVAFEDERDERATVPDHRHRCYADVRPAPRALAHQEAYCLSTAFPVCPTFQDWARREAARARDAAAASAAAAEATAGRRPPADVPATADPDGAGVAAAAAMAGSAASDLPDPDGFEPQADLEPADEDAPHDDDRHDDDPHDEGGPRRNPPREWSAPPPWLASAEASRAAPSEPPDFLSGRSDPGRGLAGSAADLLAGGSPPRAAQPGRALPPPPDVPPTADEPDFEARDLPRPVVPRQQATPARRPRAYDQHLGGPVNGPDWERPRRYEAYPTIKTRMGLPSIPRLAGMAGAVALAALALFFLPALLGVGGGEEPTASRTPSPSPSESVAPTATPAPTPVVYVIKRGDTLSKIAVANGLTTQQLLDANPTIKDPNKIIVGQSIIIPLPPSAVPDEFGGSASPSEEPAP